jgi:stress-induced morphogen
MFEEIQKSIEKELIGSLVQVSDPRDDGKHLKVVVRWNGFKDKSLLDQHRLVNNAVKHLIEIGKVHALSIETHED